MYSNAILHSSILYNLHIAQNSQCQKKRLTKEKKATRKILTLSQHMFLPCQTTKRRKKWFKRNRIIKTSNKLIIETQMLQAIFINNLLQPKNIREKNPRFNSLHQKYSCKNSSLLHYFQFWSLQILCYIMSNSTGTSIFVRYYHVIVITVMINVIN